ncbi:hypothetical protein P9265_15000 [Schinkia azotoformans]|uniref:hypothetical protein n=1 Tax=Schinkia azotoformans TaxID=1454 RepID=UPI002E242B4B|nr:hypothetical protein [Schinkia azotoformans]
MSVVTQKNVKEISDRQLIERYRKLQQYTSNRKATFHPEVYSEMMFELEIVKQNIMKRGKGEVLSQQLVLTGLEPPKKDEYEKIVIQKLREYYRQTKLYQNLREEYEKGIELLFPKVTPSYANRSAVTTTNSEFQSRTEQAVIQQEERKEYILDELRKLREEMKDMDLALFSLDELERMFIEKKHFNNRNPTDTEVIADMPVERTKYYEIRKSAYLIIAESLRLL